MSTFFSYSFKCLYHVLISTYFFYGLVYFQAQTTSNRVMYDSA